MGVIFINVISINNIFINICIIMITTITFTLKVTMHFPGQIYSFLIILIGNNLHWQVTSIN